MAAKGRWHPPCIPQDGSMGSQAGGVAQLSAKEELC